MLIKFTLKKFKITEIPSREYKRIYGESKLNTLVGIYFIFQILKYIFVKKLYILSYMQYLLLYSLSLTLI